MSLSMTALALPNVQATQLWRESYIENVPIFSNIIIHIFDVVASEVKMDTRIRLMFRSAKVLELYKIPIWGNYIHGISKKKHGIDVRYKAWRKGGSLLRMNELNRSLSNIKLSIFNVTLFILIINFSVLAIDEISILENGLALNIRNKI